jgi:hypothetical protein
MSLFIQSNLGGLVIDVERAKDAPGTAGDAFTMKFTPTTTPPTAGQLANAANQLWSFVGGPFNNSFFIQSAMNDVGGQPLVLDIKGGAAVSGATVQVFGKKPTGSATENNAAKNQLWQLVEVDEPSPGPLKPTAGFFIQSLLDSSFVIDIKGGKPAPGSALQIFKRKPVSSQADINAAANQLWSQVETSVPAPPK